MLETSQLKPRAVKLHCVQSGRWAGVLPGNPMAQLELSLRSASLRSFGPLRQRLDSVGSTDRRPELLARLRVPANPPSGIPLSRSSAEALRGLATEGRGWFGVACFVQV